MVSFRRWLGFVSFLSIFPFLSFGLKFIACRNTSCAYTHKRISLFMFKPSQQQQKKNFSSSDLFHRSNWNTHWQFNKCHSVLWLLDNKSSSYAQYSSISYDTSPEYSIGHNYFLLSSSFSLARFKLKNINVALMMKILFRLLLYPKKREEFSCCWNDGWRTERTKKLK